MLQFILRRLGLVIPTFIGITLLTFAFVHMIPGDPVMIMAGERGISPERHAQLLAELGLDKPMWQQYLHYIWGRYAWRSRHFNEKPHPCLGRVRAALPGHAGTWCLRDDFLLRQSVFRLVCWLRLNAVPFSITRRLVWH